MRSAAPLLVALAATACGALIVPSPALPIVHGNVAHTARTRLANAHGDNNDGLERPIDALVPLLIQVIPIGAFILLGRFIVPSIALPLAVVAAAILIFITQPPDER